MCAKVNNISRVRVKTEIFKCRLLPRKVMDDCVQRDQSTNRD